MVELNPDPEYWTPPMLAQAILGIWFAASHQPWMNLHFIFLTLCKHMDCIQALRAEIGDPSLLDYNDIENLPGLDSFIKEAVRLNPLDTRKTPLVLIEVTSPFISIAFHNFNYQLRIDKILKFDFLLTVAIRRKALRPFTFSHGGPHVKKGALACVSLHDAMQDEETYGNPKCFNGRRFLNTTSRFTEVSEKYPIWGFGSLAW